MTDHHERLCYRLRQGTSDTVHAGPEAALVIEHQQQAIGRLLDRVRELDRALSDAEHRLTLLLER